MNKVIGIEPARKSLGALVNEVQFKRSTIVLTRNGKPVARITPVETVGARIALREDAVPDDWAHRGHIIELNDETVVVELDDGHRQELPIDEVTVLTDEED